MIIKNCLKVSLLSLLLTACGGGGGDSGGGSSANKSTTPVNTSPKVSLSASTLTLDELTSGTFNVTVSDAETTSDNLTVTVSSSNINALSASYSAGIVSLTANDVAGDQTLTLSVVVSDGSKSSTTTATIKIVDISGLIPAPVITMDNIAQVAINQSINVIYSVSYDESATFQSESVTSTDETVLTVALEAQQIKLTGLVAGQASFVYSVVDSNNNTSEFLVDVNVLLAPPPIVTIENVAEVGSNNTRMVDYSVSFNEKTSFVSHEITSSDADVLLAALVGEQIELTGRELGQASFTYSITDNYGSVSTVTRMVTVVEGSLPPELTLKGADENGLAVIYGNEINELFIEISDPDDAEHTVSITKFEGIDSPDAVIDLINDYQIEGDRLVIDAKREPYRRVISFELELTVSDEYNTVVKSFTLTLIKRPNGAPLLKIDGTLGGFLPIPVGTTKTFSYHIVDDRPENVVITGQSLWHGDEEHFDISLNSEAQTFTITNKAPFEETYGIMFQYEDGDLGGSFPFQVTSSVVLDDLQTETLDIIQIFYNKIAGLKEYVYVAEFYGEFLENSNIITKEKKFNLVNSMKLDAQGSFNYAKVWPATLESLIVFGTWDDPAIIDSYINGVNEQMDKAIKNYSNNQLINDFVALSNGVLPQITFEPSLNEYDTENKKYSRFAGNETYGEYVDGVWVFKDEYTFMNAIIEKSFAQARIVYAH